jgi:hypothetical protein
MVPGGPVKAAHATHGMLADVRVDSGRTSMPKLHILMVEDSDADAALAAHELQKADITFSSKRVDTEAALRRRVLDVLFERALLTPSRLRDG